METLLPGITEERVPTSRLTVGMLSVTGRPGPGGPPGPAVLFVHGYAMAGGRYREVVVEDAGHGPHLDQPEQFQAELTAHLGEAASYMTG